MVLLVFSSNYSSAVTQKKHCDNGNLNIFESKIAWVYVLQTSNILCLDFSTISSQISGSFCAFFRCLKVKSDISNSHPITIIFKLAKAFETVIHSSLYDHASNNISLCQH